MGSSPYTTFQAGPHILSKQEMWKVRASMTSGPVPSTQTAHNSIAWVSADTSKLLWRKGYIWDRV